MTHPSNHPVKKTVAVELKPARPLWQEVPTRSVHGEALADFMMLIPGLRKCSPAELTTKLNRLQAVLDNFADVIEFVDLNLKLNLLWISIRPRSGISIEIPWHIRQVIPEAKLIANQVEADIGAKRKAFRSFWKR